MIDLTVVFPALLPVDAGFSAGKAWPRRRATAGGAACPKGRATAGSQRVVASPAAARRPWVLGTLLVIGACGLTFGLRSEPAAAHPHVWIDAVVTFVFEDRMLVGLRQRWVFDEFFGSFVIEEHDADGHGVFDQTEIEAIREQAFGNLREYDYFTHARLDGEKLPLAEVSDFAARIEDGLLVYEFTMPLPEPVDPGADRFAAGIYDVEYYVEVLLDQADPVRFEGLPSGACTFAIREDTESPIYYGMVYPLAITLDCATS
jgi:ABC-type uncharacterized transport system substrate-binding protein